MPAGPAHPASQLMQLAQAQAVGVFNHKGIDIGNVQSGFNDGGTHQNLNVAVGHGLHNVA